MQFRAPYPADSSKLLDALGIFTRNLAQGDI
jgi:hypothetical protein